MIKVVESIPVGRTVFGSNNMFSEDIQTVHIIRQVYYTPIRIGKLLCFGHTVIFPYRLAIQVLLKTLHK